MTATADQSIHTALYPLFTVSQKYNTTTEATIAQRLTMIHTEDIAHLIMAVTTIQATTTITTQTDTIIIVASRTATTMEALDYA